MRKCEPDGGAHRSMPMTEGFRPKGTCAERDRAGVTAGRARSLEAARGNVRNRPPQVLSLPACCGMGSFLLALSSQLVSDVDYTGRDPKRKGLSHFNAIK